MESGRLNPGVEERALLALRNCVGALCDLLEASGTAGPAVPLAQPRATGGVPPLSGATAPGSANPKAATEEKTAAETKEDESKDKRITLKSKSRSPTKKEKKQKEKVPKRKKKEASVKKTDEEATGVEKTLKAKKKAKPEKPENPPEEPREEARGSRDTVEQEEIPAEEAEEPEEPRSPVLHVRGSVADSLERSGLIDPTSTRPSEPLGPPPRHHDDREEDSRRRERSRSRTRRGTKGVQHRERGRSGVFNRWNTFGHSQWRPRPR